MTEVNNQNLINDEELNEVTAGYRGHVSKYDGVIGQTYYFVKDRCPSDYVFGTLLESWEEKILWWTRREHKVKIISTTCRGYNIGQTVVLRGDDYTMYYDK